MTAEYTTVGSLFADFVGSESWPAILTVGVVTMVYTMYGGLNISIITDQVQAIITLLFIAILTIYVAGMNMHMLKSLISYGRP
jgi:Na+/proline symporter